MRIKVHKNENYYAVFDGARTVRFAIDSKLPIRPLHYPEIEDISIGSLCNGGCNYCYASASKKGTIYTDALKNAISYYGGLPENDRPFQVAIGGGGEPTLHPDFPDILKALRELNIVPNYTTNGTNLTDKVLEATQNYSGGVAVSCHHHLPWRDAFEELSQIIRTSLHIIVGDCNSNDMFWHIYDTTENVDYYVALPYQSAGRASFVDCESEWNGFFAEAINRKPNDISFGAAFYDYLLKHCDIACQLGVDVYEPEILSGYRILDDTFTTLRKSSYDLRPKF